ncbi:hypothetical protein [Vulcanococcus limneticus]|uniref:hypothetical protein n=1 Tax=Vulcanococcus limneticus TaxID=2170428 RepID=UPI00398BD09B
MAESPQGRRIFLIGFNKCGTTSFHDFFKANGISSVHWRANTLAMAIHRHLHSGHRPLLDGLDQWTAYTDMVCIPGSPWENSNSDGHPLVEACRCFRDLQASYPHSLFILNTRDPMAWVRSRLKHDQGRFAEAYRRALAPIGVQNDAQLVHHWLQEWHEHHAQVLAHFRFQTPQDFLLFHIDHTPHDELFNFLEPHFPLTSRLFPHHHRSPSGG